MTLRQEVEVHEIHAESDYDEDDEGPVAGADGSLSNLLRSRNRKEPFENLPRPSSHPSVPQHDPHADDYDEDGDGLATNRSSPAPLSEHGIGLDKQEVHPDNAHCSMARHPVQEVDLHSIG